MITVLSASLHYVRCVAGDEPSVDILLHHPIYTQASGPAALALTREPTGQEAGCGVWKFRVLILSAFETWMSQDLAEPISVPERGGASELEKGWNGWKQLDTYLTSQTPDVDVGPGSFPHLGSEVLWCEIVENRTTFSLLYKLTTSICYIARRGGAFL
jgi:hypothetical protein